MNLVVTGLNHKTAPVSLREKVVFRREDFPKAMRLLRGIQCIRESAILSTCNRTEIYAVTTPLQENAILAHYLTEFHRIPQEKISDHLYTKEGIEAARHLFLVTAGLDSLVVGEDQILGQVKQSYKAGQEHRSIGTILHRLFQSAIEAGKRIRSETALGENPGSVGEAAVELAKQIFGDLKERAILILGAGEMGNDVALALIESGVSSVMTCSRTFENARELAGRLNGMPFPVEALDHPLSKADIVIAAASAAEPILKREQLEKIMREKRNSPLFIIDIAVPRNVEENVGRIENLFLYDIDDLKQIVRESNSNFQQEISKAGKILEEELEKFHAWQQSRLVIPTIQAITAKTDQIKNQELRKILSKFPDLGEKERRAFESLAHSLTNKILHRFFVQLKSCAEHPSGEDYLETARHLFGLDEENDA